MKSLDLDLDSKMNNLEAEWRQVYEASIAARADLERLLGCCKANGGLIDAARMRLERFEAMKARIMAKIGRLEDSMTSGAQG